MHLTVSHQFLPKQNSTRAAVVMDHFGIGFEHGRHVIAEDLDLPIRSGDVVLFTGASGSGKSSLMRAAAARLGGNAHGTQPGGFDHSTLNDRPPTVIDIDNLELGDRILIDRLPLPVGESMQLLSACGLGEAHLMLRTPAELSDGQRYRFRLALGLAHRPQWLIADEFTATLDRTLARVIAFNIRRQSDRTGTGFLLASTHQDIVEDLSPNVHVKCRLDGEIESVRNDESPGSLKKKTISFAPNLRITRASRADWPYFARWHYRSHHVGFPRFVTLLWHDEEPVGICVFVSPPISLALRNRFFGRSGRWERTSMRTLNRQLVMLSRVVVHPTYRGAGVAARFVRRSCELCPYPWIETLTQMGHINPFFESAGFVRVGSSRPRNQSRVNHSVIYGGRRNHGMQGLVTEETHRKSRYAEPVYYVFDNRPHCKRQRSRKDARG